MRALDILQSVQGFLQDQATGSADKPVRLAVVDPAYTGAPALPKVRMEGEDAVGLREYAYSYPVKANDRVAMVPVGNTWLIIGAVGGPKVTSTNYLRGHTSGRLEERTPAQVRTDIGADNATNLTTGDLPVARLDTRIVTGSVSITPVANTPTTVTWTYGRTLSGTVRAFVTPNTGVPGTTVTGVAVTTPSATAVAVYITRTNTTLTIVYCLAMGGWG